MKIHPLSKSILGVSIAAALVAAAQAQSDINWQTPLTISGPADVNTSGTLFGTWAPFNGNAGSGLTVNGVTFQAFSDLPGAADNFDNGGNNGTFASPGTSDNNYNNLLNAGAFGNNSGAYTVSWNGMTVGNSYLVQLWVNDGRNSTVNARTETVTGGLNTSLSLAYGSGNSGPGQYVIGTFVATDSSETLTLTPGPAIPSAQFNLLQVRDLSLIPEPSIFALSLAGLGIFFAISRRK
ncbi:MAG TPA: PEP-CTERM sorting domain-containing protein [Verrucomicrobiae bacterium]|nr:PEP-CTERM sorting domain-containing protein [Verrucomicrobiae bacterium]